MELSRRLRAAADLVTPGNRLADVGCDHGYLSIYLVQSGRVPRAIAMDVNKGPLFRAREHIRQYGLEGYIETRLSDGLRKLSLGEADSLVIAGMGGPLMERILEAGREKLSGIRELILQPQSEVPAFRRYLKARGYRIDAEDMVLEEGKYYPLMRAVPGEMRWEREIDFRYGKLLLDCCHPVLLRYLEQEEQSLRALEARLIQAAGGTALAPAEAPAGEPILRGAEAPAGEPILWGAEEASPAPAEAAAGEPILRGAGANRPQEAAEPVPARGGSSRARERLFEVRRELAELEEAKAYAYSRRD